MQKHPTPCIMQYKSLLLWDSFGSQPPLLRVTPAINIEATTPICLYVAFPVLSCLCLGKENGPHRRSFQPEHPYHSNFWYYDAN